MASSPSLDAVDRSAKPADRAAPFRRVHAVNVFVRDQDQSLRFYVDQLGFSLAFDVRLQTGQRSVGVSPPDGTAVLMLIAPSPESEQYKLIGRPTGVTFVAEDVVATYTEWRGRGVHFGQVPRLRRIKPNQPSDEQASARSLLLGKQKPIWGGVFSRFEDIDKNTFALVSFDEMTQGAAARRGGAARIRTPRGSRTCPRQTGTGAPLPAEFPSITNLGLLRRLYSGSTSWWRLLRLSASRRRAHRPCARRHRRQGNCRGASNGESAGEPAKSVHRHLA